MPEHELSPDVDQVILADQAIRGFLLNGSVDVVGAALLQGLDGVVLASLTAQTAARLAEEDSLSEGANNRAKILDIASRNRSVWDQVIVADEVIAVHAHKRPSGATGSRMTPRPPIKP